MRFEWDEVKNTLNYRKHSFRFEEAVEVFSSVVISTEDIRFNYGEKRIVSVGVIENTIVVVVHTQRGAVTRIISARKANKKERKKYYADLTKTGNPAA